MTNYFAQVLALECDRLGRVKHAKDLAAWRASIIENAKNPRSPYALAIRPVGDSRKRADFLEQWAGLLARMIQRLDQDADAARTASLILAAVHGGTILSRLDRDSAALEAALDLALAPLLDTGT